MATVPNPRTWVNEQVTDAKLNTDVRDAWNFFLNKPVAILTRLVSDQAIAASSATAIIWQTEQLDRDGGHSTVTNTTRYTAQTAGYYHVYVKARWVPSGAANGWMDMYIRKNGTTNQSRTTVVGQTVFPNGWTQMCSGFVSLAVNDYIEAIAQPLVEARPISLISDCYMYVEWVSI